MPTDHRSPLPRFSLKRLLLGMALAAVGLTIYRWWPVDGIGGALMGAVWGDNTVWAPGYTDAGFGAVRTGMTRSEVHALLGQPLGSFSRSGDVVESWTEMGELNESTHYDCSVYYRWVTFHGDVVVSKFAEFSPD